ncbi:MAG TPA: hypothetical protein VG843_12920 [Rhizomicrobium sp.]|jgi:hypothetical protein|nr:hypothetical protein [Rhizomicrobium sp.]
MGAENAKWGLWLALAILAAIILGGVGLSIYGGRLEPVSRHYEQAVPDDRLPH